jgi:hypothetical protein
MLRRILERHIAQSDFYHFPEEVLVEEAGETVGFGMTVTSTFVGELELWGFVFEAFAFTILLVARALTSDINSHP